MTRHCVLYPGIRLATEGGHGKHLSQGSRKIPVWHDSVCRHDQLLQVASTSLTIPVSLETLWVTWVTLWKKRFLAYICARLVCVCMNVCTYVRM